MNQPLETQSTNLRRLADLIQVVEDATITPEMHSLAQEIDTRALTQELRDLVVFIAATPLALLGTINQDLPAILAKLWPFHERLSANLRQAALLMKAIETQTVSEQILDAARTFDDRALHPRLRGLIGYMRRSDASVLDIRRDQFRTALAHKWVFRGLLSTNLRQLADLMEAIEEEKVTPEMQDLAGRIDHRALMGDLGTLISMIAGTVPSQLENMNGDYRAVLGRTWNSPEKLSDNLRQLAKLVEAVENEAVTLEIRELAQEINRQALVSELRTVISMVAGSGPPMLSSAQEGFSVALDQALRSLEN